MTSPNMQEARNASAQEEKEIECAVCDERASFNVSRQLPPMIVGIESRKEKRTASLASQPSTWAQEIVEALREIPGMRAADCIVPIQSTSLTFCFHGLTFSLRVMRSLLPRNKIAAVSNRQGPKNCG